MDDFEFLIDELGEGEVEEKYWMCEDCNLDDIDSNETRCPRCGHKHKTHHERSEEAEVDEDGNPVDISHYEEHY